MLVVVANYKPLSFCVLILQITYRAWSHQTRLGFDPKQLDDFTYILIMSEKPG
jgi:hypothetical protein